eukprot:1160406-Pelagomonas_calceolata.AAC.6
MHCHVASPLAYRTHSKIADGFYTRQCSSTALSECTLQVRHVAEHRACFAFAARTAKLPSLHARTAFTARPFWAHSLHSGPVLLVSALGSTVSPPSVGVVLQRSENSLGWTTAKFEEKQRSENSLGWTTAKFEEKQRSEKGNGQRTAKARGQQRPKKSKGQRTAKFLQSGHAPAFWTLTK